MRRFLIFLILSGVGVINGVYAQNMPVHNPGDKIVEFSRGIEQTTFVPKGQWITGVSVSYSQSSQKDYQFLIIEDINGESYSFKVSPMVMYAFADNLAAGLRLGYKRQRTHLDEANFVLASDMDYQLDNLYSISHNFYATGALRNYISLGDNKRFGLFNEVQLEFGAGQAKLCNGTGNDLTGTFTTSYSIDVGLAPGFAMFLSNYSAIEVNVGVLGFSYTHSKLITDQIYEAHIKTKAANFRVNLFSITFGVVFYL